MQIQSMGLKKDIVCKMRGTLFVVVVCQGSSTLPRGPRDELVYGSPLAFPGSLGQGRGQRGRRRDGKD